MNNTVKKSVSVIVGFLLIVGAFLAGNCSDWNVLSMLGLSSDTHTVEPIPDTETHTAEEAVTVENVVPFDDEGNGSVVLTQQKVPYVVEVDFAPVLLKETGSEKKLIIMTQKALAPEVAEKPGLWGISAFKQTKAMIFHGEATYYIDLSDLSRNDFAIDNEKRAITVFIPKPQFSVKLLPEETEFFDASNGVLRFGEMQLAPEILTMLETQGIARITETLENDSNTWKTVQRFAKLAVKEIYEPLITAQVDAAVKRAADEFAIPAYYTITVEIRD